MAENTGAGALAPAEVNDKDTKAVFAAQEKGREDHEKAWAEREAAGFAPRLRYDDTRPREVREAETRKALGHDPAGGAVPAEHRKAMGTGGTTMRIPSSADDVREIERLRVPPDTTMSTGETVDVIVNGVTYRCRAGEEAKLPGPVAEVLRQSRMPMQTRQGPPIVDLTQ